MKQWTGMGTLRLRTPSLPPLHWRKVCHCECQNDINVLSTIEEAQVLYVSHLFSVGLGLDLS